MKIIKPPHLKKGQTIGVVSVSSPDAFVESERFHRGVQSIKNRGFEMKIGSFTEKRHGYLCGTEIEMAEDLNSMFSDHSVSAIFCAGGGTNANRLLRHLDYELIRANPKIFVGVSNPSVLLNAVYAQTGLVTFHGPTVVWNFGAPMGLTEYTQRHFWPTIESPLIPANIEPTSGWKWFRQGLATGRLVGGNLASIQGLLGTPWEPEWKDSIFFWEDVAKPTNRLDMALTHFRDAGVFEKISGMVVGSLVECDPPEGGQTLDEILTDLVGEFDFPVLSGVDFGHTDDKATLALGVEARIDSNSGEFALLESAVS
jgi:muramoyltetrapeptide carboxypeptidase